MNLGPAMIETLACPRCKGTLTNFDCAVCHLSFPVVNEVPVLINDENSLFKIADFVEMRDTTWNSKATWKRKLKPFIPSITLNRTSRRNLAHFFEAIKVDSPKVLIVGGAIEGSGLAVDEITNKFTIVETDVAFGERTQMICDAHDLPFKDRTYDGVIVQFVLEHVLDPQRCVSEVHRILKSDGHVYSDTPFMQQVHAGRYDFGRFSHLGHRRLFRRFAEIDSGASCGAGTVLAWSWCWFLQSFFSNQTLGQAAWAFGSFTSFWLKYFDYVFAGKPTAFDAASSYYFIGKKSDETLSDTDLIAGYKGAIY